MTKTRMLAKGRATVMRKTTRSVQGKPDGICTMRCPSIRRADLSFFFKSLPQVLVEQQLERDYELYLEQKSHKLKCVVGRRGNSLSLPPAFIRCSSEGLLGSDGG